MKFLLNLLVALLGLLVLTTAVASPNSEQTADDEKSSKEAEANRILPTGCKDKSVKCLAQQDNGLDGGVFECVNGSWKMIQDCRTYERCVENPIPHCTWSY